MLVKQFSQITVDGHSSPKIYLKNPQNFPTSYLLTIIVAHRGQHVDIIIEVAHKRDDAHSLSEPLNLAEEEHETVFLS